jgi:ribosomal protein S19E (S16A)
VLNILSDEMKQILVFLNLNRKMGSIPTSISEITRVVKGPTAQYRRGGKIKQGILEQIREVLQALESTNLIELVQDDEYRITKNGITIAEQVLKALLETEQSTTVEDDPFSRHFWQLLGF